jgi:hypothetical protein
VAWTDERLDDGFDRLDRDIRELRTEMKDEFGVVRGEMGDLRTEMKDEFSSVRGETGEMRTELKSEIGELRNLISRLDGGIFITVVAAALLRLF